MPTKFDSNLQCKINNFHEIETPLRSKAEYLARKKKRNVELKLERMFPGRFIPRYSMVSFHQIPYSEVYQRGGKQFKIIDDVLKADPSGQFIDKAMVEKMLPEPDSSH